jgi:uncharacterized protein (DUF1800 family)
LLRPVWQAAESLQLFPQPGFLVSKRLCPLFGMRRNLRRLFYVPFAILAFSAMAVFASHAGKDKNLVAAQMDEHQRAIHALNRLTFGARPEEVQRVEALGVAKWIDLQLQPNKIDDSALEGRLAPFRTLRMSTEEIVENFPPPQLIKAVAEGKQRLPSDPTKRAVYQAQLEKYREKQEGKQNATDSNIKSAATRAPGDDTPEGTNQQTDPQAAARREARLYADLTTEELLDLPPEQRMKRILSLPPEEQRALATRKATQDGNLFEDMSPQQKETVMALNNPGRVVVQELMQAKLLRAIYSERQLDEVMTDFWFNHFNVFINKGADRYLVTSYERDVIHPRALGKFEDLLVAAAQSPAMLFYLDNWLSVGPDSDAAQGVPEHRPHVRRKRRPFPEPQQPRARRVKQHHGLNENYARELMELHTLGVDGGYTQEDVTEVARVLTGWTIDRPKQGGEFKFETRMHEPGTKVVLGHEIKEKGEQEGREVLHMLAHHPCTAKFISGKLAARFVSDNPPPELVNRMAETFLKKDGDIREVLRTMFHSPEFWAPESYRAKVKTPLEFVVSAVRATGANVQDAAPLIGTLNSMGMLPYGMQPPTGYSMKAEPWVNASALVSRMNFALALSTGKIKGIGIQQDFLDSHASQHPGAILANLENELLADDVSRQTHETILKQMGGPEIVRKNVDEAPRSVNIGLIEGLILGSPEFQRR